MMSEYNPDTKGWPDNLRNCSHYKSTTPYMGSKGSFAASAGEPSIGACGIPFHVEGVVFVEMDADDPNQAISALQTAWHSVEDAITNDCALLQIWSFKKSKRISGAVVLGEHLSPPASLDQAVFQSVSAHIDRATTVMNALCNQLEQQGFAVRR